VSRGHARTSSGATTLAALVAVAGLGAGVLPWTRCRGRTADSGPGLTSTPHDEAAPQRVAPGGTPATAPPTKPARRLADDVVVRALDVMQPAFLRCYKRSQRDNPRSLTLKVNVHLEIDAAGAVTAATTDLRDDAPLAACILAVAKKLPFPVPYEPVFVDIPLHFRPM
jgi:hypothetical protein